MLYCCVKYCRSKSDNSRLFRFPNKLRVNNKAYEDVLAKRRLAWFKAIEFKNKNILSEECLDTYRVCGCHFKSGEPAHFLDVENVDWIPTIDVNSSNQDDTSRTPRKRPDDVIIRSHLKKRKLFENDELDRDDEDNILVEIPTKDACTQTDMSSEDISIIVNEVSQLKRAMRIQRLEKEAFDDSNQKKLTYYTGLPNLAIFLLILNEIEDFLTKIRVRKLSNFQKLLLVLMKLRLNVDFTDLGYRFGIKTSTASSIFRQVIICLDYSFRELIHWPDRDELRAAMPNCFKSKFGNRVAVIIDCFEIPMQRPSLLRSKAEAYSHYKSRVTIKYLIGITPHGFISFLSQGWGGRASDVHITEECGILDNLLPGDIVLADRGFNVHVLVGQTHATLNIPDFTRGKKQLSPYEVMNTRKIASVRIHVERVIGVVRSKYTILNSPIPVRLLNKTYEGKFFLDYIVRVTCMLVNLCDSIITD